MEKRGRGSGASASSTKSDDELAPKKGKMARQEMGGETTRVSGRTGIPVSS